MKTNPNKWIAPKWHSDFGNPNIELEMLKKMCIILIKEKPEYEVELDCFEEGYMKVDIYKNNKKYGELYITEKGEIKRYGLFLYVNTDEEEEIYFNNYIDGLKYF